MTPERWQQIKTVLTAASALPPRERIAYLDGACAGDPELRNEVESLLRAVAGSRIDTGGGAAAARAALGTDTLPPELVIPANTGDAVAGSTKSTLQTSPLREAAGTLVGRYKLLQQIGEGGFGAVFMAEQREPVVRKVALKIIKLGMDTKQVIARFEAERQALAMMDHPNIARVFDAGATDTGRPYFVMELVRGVPITHYCDTNNLTAAERLSLFIPVCQAVQHAHQKGVIHRDLKPSNILVTLHDGRPMPKVIDFGIAKATNARLTEKTLFTELKAVIGTPAYMPPEQAELSGLDIDTRSDVYSLGVLLYELLTGTPPFSPWELLEAGYAEMQRIIREVEPPKPSIRVTLQGSVGVPPALSEPRPPGSGPLSPPSSIRRSVASSLAARLRGDLDWIVMKCLEKDRRRRYDTANDLAADVQRHLSGEPVVAAPPSGFYRVQKFVHRHRAGVAVAIALAIVLSIGIVGTTWALTQAQQERHRAETQRLLARQEAARALLEQRKSEAAARFAALVSEEATKRRRISADRVRELEETASHEVTQQSEHSATPPAIPTAFVSDFNNLPVCSVATRPERGLVSLPAGVELHAVGVYEGYDRIDDVIVGPRADVRVDRPGAVVALVLTAYDRTSWHVVATPGTRIAAVILGGHGPQRLLGDFAEARIFNAGRPAHGGDGDYLGYCYDANSESGPEFFTALQRLARAPLATFQGAYRADCRRAFVIDGSHAHTPIQSTFPTSLPIAEIPDVRFAVLDRVDDSGGGRVVEFSLRGPTGRVLLDLPSRMHAIACDGRRNAFYGTTLHEVFAFDGTAARRFDPGFEVPDPSWVAGITYDSKRERLLVSSFGGDGYLYAVTPDGAWSTIRSFENTREITALTYDATRDVFFGLYYGGSSLLTLDRDGHEIGCVKLGGAIAPNCLGWEHTQLVATSGLLIAVNYGITGENGKWVARRAIHLIEPETGQVRLAHAGW